MKENLKFIGILLLIFCAGFLAALNIMYEPYYKDGQIDALRGHQKYKMLITYDTTVTITETIKHDTVSCYPLPLCDYNNNATCIIGDEGWIYLANKNIVIHQYFVERRHEVLTPVDTIFVKK